MQSQQQRQAPPPPPPPPRQNQFPSGGGIVAEPGGGMMYNGSHNPRGVTTPSAPHGQGGRGPTMVGGLGMGAAASYGNASIVGGGGGRSYQLGRGGKGGGGGGKHRGNRKGGGGGSSSGASTSTIVVGPGSAGAASAPAAGGGDALSKEDVPLGPLNESYKFFIANIAYEKSPQEIKEWFAQFGVVNHVRIIYEKNGKSKGYGFLFMNDSSGTQSLEHFSNSNNNKITVMGRTNVHVQRQDETHGGKQAGVFVTAHDVGIPGGAIGGAAGGTKVLHGGAGPQAYCDQRGGPPIAYENATSASAMSAPISAGVYQQGNALLSSHYTTTNPQEQLQATSSQNHLYTRGAPASQYGTEGVNNNVNNLLLGSRPLSSGNTYESQRTQQYQVHQPSAASAQQSAISYSVNSQPLQQQNQLQQQFHQYNIDPNSSVSNINNLNGTTYGYGEYDYGAQATPAVGINGGSGLHQLQLMGAMGGGQQYVQTLSQMANQGGPLPVQSYQNRAQQQQQNPQVAMQVGQPFIPHGTDQYQTPFATSYKDYDGSQSHVGTMTRSQMMSPDQGQHFISASSLPHSVQSQQPVQQIGSSPSALQFAQQYQNSGQSYPQQHQQQQVPQSSQPQFLSNQVKPHDDGAISVTKVMLQNLPPNTLIQELIDYLHSLAPSGTNYFSICNATLQFDQNSNGVPPSWCIAHVEFNDPAAASDIFSMSAAGNLIFRGRRLMAYADNTTQVLGRAMVSSHMPASSSLNGQNVAASIAHSPYVASGAPLHSASHQQLLMNNLPIKSAGPLPNGQDRRAYGSGPGGSGRGGRGGKRGGGRGGGGRDGRIREGRRDRPY